MKQATRVVNILYHCMLAAVPCISVMQSKAKQAVFDDSIHPRTCDAVQVCKTRYVPAAYDVLVPLYQ